MKKLIAVLRMLVRRWHSMPIDTTTSLLELTDEEIAVVSNELEDLVQSNISTESVLACKTVGDLFALLPQLKEKKDAKKDSCSSTNQRLSPHNKRHN